MYRALGILALGIGAMSSWPAWPQRPAGEAICRCPGMAKPLGSAANCNEACSGRSSVPSSGSPAPSSPSPRATPNMTVDPEASRRAYEAEQQRYSEEVRRRLEEERQREESSRAERARREADFLRDRDAAAATLRGSGGASSPPPDSIGLRGSRASAPSPLDPIAAAADLRRLKDTDAELTKAIARDLGAIRNLHFDRRAEDFAAWAELATDARNDFETTVKSEAAGVIADFAKGKVLKGVEAFDKAKADRWIGALSKMKPKPVEIIDAIERLSRSIGKPGQMAKDAENLVKVIERARSAMDVKDLQTALPLLSEVVCDFVRPPFDKQCEAFRAISVVTTAAVYNNLTLRVSRAEVARLLKMTDEQLLHLKRLNELLVKHIGERNAVRTKIASLPSS